MCSIVYLLHTFRRLITNEIDSMLCTMNQYWYVIEAAVVMITCYNGLKCSLHEFEYTKTKCIKILFNHQLYHVQHTGGVLLNYISRYKFCQLYFSNLINYLLNNFPFFTSSRFKIIDKYWIFVWGLSLFFRQVNSICKKRKKN